MECLVPISFIAMHESSPRIYISNPPGIHIINESNHCDKFSYDRSCTYYVLFFLFHSFLFCPFFEADDHFIFRQQKKLFNAINIVFRSYVLYCCCCCFFCPVWSCYILENNDMSLFEMLQQFKLRDHCSFVIFVCFFYNLCCDFLFGFHERFSLLRILFRSFAPIARTASTFAYFTRHTVHDIFF